MTWRSIVGGKINWVSNGGEKLAVECRAASTTYDHFHLQQKQYRIRSLTNEKMTLIFNL